MRSRNAGKILGLACLPVLGLAVTANAQFTAQYHDDTNNDTPNLTDALALINDAIPPQATTLSPTGNQTDDGSVGQGRSAAGETVVAFGDNYAVNNTGFLVIPTAGDYTFFTNTDDGALVLIDGVEVVRDDALQGPTDSAYGAINLSAGQHAIQWVWFDNCCGGTGELWARQGNFAAPKGQGNPAGFALVGDVAGGGLAVVVPEPASLGLLGLGALGLLARRRR